MDTATDAGAVATPDPVPPPLPEELLPEEPPAVRQPIPYVTIGLAVANVIVFAISVAAGADPISPSADKMFELGGNFGQATLSGEPWRLFTSMFLHYGLLHIAMNMIGLLDGGRHVERMYGRAAFAAIYLFSGLVGSLASALPGKAVSAGASGAIFGVFGAFGAFLVVRRHQLDKEQVKKQSRGLLVFLAYNIFFGLQAQGIDLLAHFGGLVAGFVAGLVLASPRHAQGLVRVALVGVIGSGLVIAATYVVPKPSTLVMLGAAKANFERFAKLEQAALDRYNQLIATVKSSGMADVDIAKVIDEEILVMWRQGKAVLANLDGLPADFETGFRNYVATREAAFVGMAEALRASDPAGVERAMVKMREADAFVATLKP